MCIAVFFDRIEKKNALYIAVIEFTTGNILFGGG